MRLCLGSKTALSVFLLPTGKCPSACGPDKICCNGNCASRPGPVLSGLQTTQLCGTAQNPKCCSPCQPPGSLPDWDGGSMEQLTCAVVNEARRQGLRLWPQWAYIMATIEHETAKNYKPNRECYDLPRTKVAECDKKLKRYAPYYGRGYVQVTFKTNYAKFQVGLEYAQCWMHIVSWAGHHHFGQDLGCSLDCSH
jgi:hypothetical protein